jgi:monoamine oxidase
VDLTRRQFVAAALAVPQQSGQRILVLGGGLAGLASAFELQKSGHSVTVLEAQSRPGGRVRTLRDNLAVYVEAGAEQIPGAHDLTISYAKQLGLNLLRTGVPNTRSFYHLKGKNAPFPAEFAGVRKKHIDAAVAAAQAAGGTANVVKAMSRWDGQTPGAWLRSEGASAEAVALLTVGFGAEFGSAASYLLHIVNSTGGTGSFRIEGGNDHLPRALAMKVLDLRYNAPAVRVRQDDRSVHVTLGDGQTLTGDCAICALPCPAIGRILDEARLSPAKRTAIREQNYSHTVKVFLPTRTRFWLREALSGHVTTDRPIERLTPDPGIAPDERGALTAYPIGAYSQALEKMSEEQRVSAALAQAREIFPKLAAEFEGGVSKAWGLDPWQRGAFALHTPGQISFIDTLAKPEGRIHFAGEHTSAWTGWMQGALESARRVVHEIGAA